MDTNTKTFLDYMDYSNDGSITYVAEKITQDYEKQYGVIEDATSRQVVNTVEKLIIDHASSGSKGYEMGTQVNIAVVQLAPITVWLQRFSGKQMTA